MSYWQSDSEFLEEFADEHDELPGEDLRRIRDIAHDLGRATPDGEFLEELAGKIETWAAERVLPTQGFVDEITDHLTTIALALKRSPTQ